MRILVIEDDAGIAAGLRTTLQQRGYAVDVCGDVASAWSALRTERFDAVLLDLGLPDADGSVLLQRLRSAPATVGASAQPCPTGYTGAHRDRARPGAATHCRAGHGRRRLRGKPFDIDELDARLRALLRARRAGGSPPSAMAALSWIPPPAPFGCMGSWWKHRRASFLCCGCC